MKKVHFNKLNNAIVTLPELFSQNFLLFDIVRKTYFLAFISPIPQKYQRLFVRDILYLNLDTQIQVHKTPKTQLRPIALITDPLFIDVYQPERGRGRSHLLTSRFEF